MKNEYPPGMSRGVLDPQESKLGVYDLIVPKDFHVKPMIVPNILVCIELSAQMVSSGLFEATLQHIQNTLGSITYEANLGIVTFNHSLTYYSIPDDLTNENVKRISCVDFESPFCALSQEELYLSVSKSREKLDFLINHLTEASKNYDTSKPSNINLDILLESVALSMEQTGGKVLIFGALPPTLGKSVTPIIEADDGKSDKSKFSLKNEYIEEKAALFNQLRICVDQFWFHKVAFPVSTLGHISQRTGGKFYFYQDYNEFTHYNQVFYEVYNCLTRYTAYEVVARLRCSESVSLLNFHTPIGFDPQPDVSIASMNSDHCLIAHLDTSQIKTNAVHFQLVLIHSDFYGYRKLRVINFVLMVSNNMDTFYNYINCEALAYFTLRSAADQIKQVERESMRMKVLSLVSDIVKEYRRFVDSLDQVNRPGFEVPPSLEHIVMYTHSMLREQIFNTKIAHPCSLIYNNYLTLIQSSLTSVLNYLYPKIFPVHDLDMNAEQGVVHFYQAWPAVGRQGQLHYPLAKEHASI